MPRAGGVGVSCIVNSNQTFHQSFSPVHFNASWQVLSHHVGGLWSISISQSSPVLIEELIQMFSPPPQQLVLSIIKSGNWKKVRLELDTTLVLVLSTHSSLWSTKSRNNNIYCHNIRSLICSADRELSLEWLGPKKGNQITQDPALGPRGLWLMFY